MATVSMSEITRVALYNSNDPKIWEAVRHNSKQDAYVDIVLHDATYITKDMHFKLLQWKMSQGKSRPMLLKYARDLTDEVVETTSREAFALCKEGKYMAAMEKYKTLKGTGYALASLVLTTQCANIPFMSDQLLGLMYSESEIKYSKKEFVACYDYANKKAQEISQASNSAWSARDIELCLRKTL